MKWIYIRDTYHSVSNINKIKFNENNSVNIWFVGEDSSTVYYELTDNERKLITNLVKNDN